MKSRPRGEGSEQSVIEPILVTKLLDSIYEYEDSSIPPELMRVQIYDNWERER